MSKKDYVLIASVMSDVRYIMVKPAYRELVDNISEQLGKALEKENPRFDRQRFLKACGLTELEN